MILHIRLGIRRPESPWDGDGNPYGGSNVSSSNPTTIALQRHQADRTDRDQYNKATPCVASPEAGPDLIRARPRRSTTWFLLHGSRALAKRHTTDK